MSYGETNQVAIDWFGRAAIQGNKDALWQLAVMEYAAVLGPPRIQRGHYNFNKKLPSSARLKRMYKLALALYKGNGVQKDWQHRVALAWTGHLLTKTLMGQPRPVHVTECYGIGVDEHGYGVGNDLGARLRLVQPGPHRHDSKIMEGTDESFARRPGICCYASGDFAVEPYARRARDPAFSQTELPGEKAISARSAVKQSRILKCCAMAFASSCLRGSGQMAAQSVNGTNVGKHHGRGDSRRAAIGCAAGATTVIAGRAAYSAPAHWFKARMETLCCD